MTNANKKKGADYSKPKIPASFKSKYSEYRMQNEGNQHKKFLNMDKDVSKDYKTGGQSAFIDDPMYS